MKIYHYDPDTGALLGESDARKDPAEHELAQEAAHAAIARPAHEALQAALAELPEGSTPEAAFAAHAEAMEQARAAAAAVEPAHWLVPANATVIAPLKPKDGHQVLFRDGKWIREKIAAPEPPAPPPEPTYADRRRAAYAPIVEQLEMLHQQLKAHGLDGEFTAHVDAVKAAHPKPDS